VKEFLLVQLCRIDTEKKEGNVAADISVDGVFLFITDDMSKPAD